MKRSLPISFAFALFHVAALYLPAHAAGVSGAIFTTTVDGTAVNDNQYNSKCAVYLDGGPGPNAPAKAAGLPDGDYYFQVTDPSGKQLLSTDPVSNRHFQVANGVITAHTGTHPTSIDQDHWELGAITIGLADANCPADFLDTPNNGGVYKVWATPVGDFVGDPAQVDNDCGKGCYHGFVPSKSKTDNFNVSASAQTFCLTIAKEFRDTLGQFIPFVGWKMSVEDPLGSVNDFFTGEGGQVQVCGLAPGAYTVTEEIQDFTQVVGLIVNGVSLPPQPVYSFTWDSTQPEPFIVFQNEEDESSDQ